MRRTKEKTMKKSCRPALILAGILALCPQVLAHEAHEHGVARMNISVEGNEVEIEMKSPLANFLSFEHRPETEAQRQEVRDMAAKLRRPGALFVLTEEAQCRQTGLDMDSGVLDDALLLPEGRSGKHKAGHGHAHEAPEGHADIGIELEFHCKHPEKLRSLTAPIFRQFPALREIEAQMVTPAGQRSAELTPESDMVRW